MWEFTLFPRGAIPDMHDVLLKVDYFVADKGKSLNCRVFIEAEMSLYACKQILHNLYTNNFLPGSLIKFFVTKVF